MAFLTKPGILALLRNRLRLNDVTLPLSSLLVILRDLSAQFSYTHKLENVYQFAYSSCRQLAFRSQFYAYLTSSQGGVQSFYSGLIVLVHVRISQCDFLITWGARGMQGT